jgi:hydroxyethylthiazole kinase-like uncharacterized protein yjeF
MRVVTAEQMRSIDRKTVEEYGITGAVLMERAGLAVSLKIRELFEKRKVVVLAGSGNNGGDGIVVARDLFNRGWNARVIVLAKKGKLSPGCLAQYRIAKEMGVPVVFRTTVSGADLHSAVVVDAIFGTGLSRPFTSPLADVVRFLNASGVPVISVDLPSGISSDNGQVMEEAVRADYTVTFGLPKVGHVIYPGAEHCGELFVENIGFPEELLASDAIGLQTIERAMASALVPERPAYSHKGDYGHVLVVAGSKGKTGAALMTARACLRAGAGMVTIGIPETLAGVFQSRVTEEMVLPLPDNGGGILAAGALSPILEFLDRKADVLAMGPGITSGPDVVRILEGLLPSAAVPMVLDADAINAISGKTDILSKVKSPIVLTPHPGEMARLLRTRSRGAEETELRNSIERDRINTALSFARGTGAYLVLKGVPTIIAEPEGKVFINTTGNPGMATAGAGDVLTGIIAGCVGQGMGPLDASVLGTYLHGLSGDIASSKKGMHSLVAGDLIDSLPEAFRELLRVT